MSHNAALLRVLGLGFALAVAVGNSVGQGIMRTPGIVAGAMHTPLAIIAVWAACAVIASIDAFAVAELAASNPCSGGAYAFTRRAFGPLAGMLTGWGDQISGILSVSFVSVVFGEYVHRLGMATALPIGVLAAALIALVTALNWMGTRSSGGSQVAITLAKAALLVAMVALLLAAPRSTLPPAPFALSPALTLGGVVVAMRATLVTYVGWQNAAYFCEEVARPERTAVRALFGGIAVVAALYIAINLALLHVLSPAQMAGSVLPAADALGGAYGTAGALLTTVIALVSVFGTANLQTMTCSRVFHAFGRDGLLPPLFHRVHPRGTPRQALLLTSAMSVALALSGDYDALIAASAVVGQGLFLVMDLAAVRMRAIEPDLPRPFRMPLFPLPALLGAAINTALIAALVWEDPWHSLAGVFALVVLAFGYIGLARYRRQALPID